MGYKPFAGGLDLLRSRGIPDRPALNSLHIIEAMNLVGVKIFGNSHANGMENLLFLVGCKTQMLVVVSNKYVASCVVMNELFTYTTLGNLL